MGDVPEAGSDDLLARPVHAEGRSRAFGELTRAQVRERAAELRASVGFGPTARVASVAMAWRELADLMDRAQADTVGQLHREALAERAEKLWVVAPRGGLLGG